PPPEPAHKRQDLVAFAVADGRVEILARFERTEAALGKRSDVVLSAHAFGSDCRMRSNRMSSTSRGRSAKRLVRIKSSMPGSCTSMPAATETGRRAAHTSSNATRTPSTVVTARATRTSTCSSFSRTYRPRCQALSARRERYLDDGDDRGGRNSRRRVYLGGPTLRGPCSRRRERCRARRGPGALSRWPGCGSGGGSRQRPPALALGHRRPRLLRRIDPVVRARSVRSAEPDSGSELDSGSRSAGED